MTQPKSLPEPSAYSSRRDLLPPPLFPACLPAPLPFPDPHHPCPHVLSPAAAPCLLGGPPAHLPTRSALLSALLPDLFFHPRHPKSPENALILLHCFLLFFPLLRFYVSAPAVSLIPAITHSEMQRGGGMPQKPVLGMWNWRQAQDVPAAAGL